MRRMDSWQVPASWHPNFGRVKGVQDLEDRYPDISLEDPYPSYAPNKKALSAQMEKVTQAWQ